ncbi:MAG TPA: hypothetical protein VLV54_10100 [Thermoanaerobaculia bacterium]|nr:hypothetical protein [Thermoanaerobaculia bacterium]
MANLTSDRRIAYPARDLDPVPGYDLVILKRGGRNGFKIRALLRPGERLRKSLLERRSSLVGYAVKHEERLRHRFSRSYRTGDQIGSFILDFAIDFEVADPILLVLSLDSDPLRLLEEKIDALIRSAIPRETAPSFGEEICTLLESRLADIRSFASAFGLKVRNVSPLPLQEVRNAVNVNRELRGQGTTELAFQDERLDIRDLRGAGGIRPDYDYKALRTEDPHRS